jgi:hypothetical protein
MLDYGNDFTNTFDKKMTWSQPEFTFSVLALAFNFGMLYRYLCLFLMSLAGILLWQPFFRVGKRGIY